MIIFIPIKKNSERVPRKNFRLIGGKPLYKHTIERVNQFKVFVDTDCDEVFEECNKMQNVKAFYRKEALIGDEVSVCDLIENFIINYNITEKICQMHVTSPFIKSKTLEEAQEYLSHYDSVASCDIIQERLWVKSDNCYLPVNHNPEILLPTQKLEKMYKENSIFYMFDPQKFLKVKKRILENNFFYQCNFPENIDIDYEKDWNTCVEVYKSQIIKI